MSCNPVRSSLQHHARRQQPAPAARGRALQWERPAAAAAGTTSGGSGGGGGGGSGGGGGG